MTRVDIVVAVRNEEQSIPVFLEKIAALPLPSDVDLKVVFIEDSSTDATRPLLRRLAQESARSSGLSVRFRLRRGGPAELTEDSATQLYRIAQEATSNALRHANAKQVVIGLTLSEAKTRLVIDDDGGGIRARQEHAGLGLHLMKYRAGLMGATLTIESRARRGTRVTCVKYAQGDAAA